METENFQACCMAAGLFQAAAGEGLVTSFPLSPGQEPQHSSASPGAHPAAAPGALHWT